MTPAWNEGGERERERDSDSERVFSGSESGVRGNKLTRRKNKTKHDVSRAEETCKRGREQSLSTFQPKRAIKDGKGAEWTVFLSHGGD